tara:strand:+ start:349 stop:858 length:510 start_codon:yes stop_codon:yes gene_type:complete
MSFLLTSGCGILHPPHKDAQGFYTTHYNSCGPEAVKNALDKYFTKEGIVFFKQPFIAKEISQHIQKSTPPFPFDRRGWVIMFDRKAVKITWPSEIKTACQKYGVKLRAVNVEYLNDHPDEIYIILCHKKWSIYDYHWFTHPRYSGSNLDFYGEGKTVIDTVYLLEPLQK